MKRKSIAIIGAGPAGMIAADVLAPFHDVTVYEQGRTVGRKFLVAGKGGFNLTNQVDGAELKSRYRPIAFMDEALDGFGSKALRNWLQELGIGTYVGSSGRVFPDKGIKPITVLYHIRGRLVQRGVIFRSEHTFVGFDEKVRPLMESRNGRRSIDADRIIMALGGSSWPVTGSTGAWAGHFERIGVPVAPFAPSNCGIHVPWPSALVRDHAGKPLKNIRVDTHATSVLGEVTITEHGLEGNAIYPVVPGLRDALRSGSSTSLSLDLKPNNSLSELVDRTKGMNAKDVLVSLRLDRAATAVLKAFTDKTTFLSPDQLVRAVKALQVPVTGLRPMEEAISSVGGIRPEDLHPDFSIKVHPHLHTIGEMVDWDAPTGGFLLQGCFAMGHHAASSILRASTGDL